MGHWSDPALFLWENLENPRSKLWHTGASENKYSIWKLVPDKFVNVILWSQDEDPWGLKQRLQPKKGSSNRKDIYEWMLDVSFMNSETSNCSSHMNCCMCAFDRLFTLVLSIIKISKSLFVSRRNPRHNRKIMEQNLLILIKCLLSYSHIKWM